MATNEGEILRIFNISINFIFITEDNNLSFTLQLFHILSNQISFLIITNNERTNKFLILYVLTDITITKTFDIVIF